MLVAWSYRAAFFSDFANLARADAPVLLHRQARADATPCRRYGGVQATYLEFVTLGVVINVFVQVALTRIADALRQEQMIGTLEPLLVTPTATATVQLGSAVFDLVYMPLRTAVFLGVHGALRGRRARALGNTARRRDPAGLHPVRVGPRHRQRGRDPHLQARQRAQWASGALLLGLTSGAFFPLALLPALDRRRWPSTTRWRSRSRRSARRSWAAPAGRAWATTCALLVPLSTLALLAGSLAFRLALRRERRRGTLGLY